MEATANLRPLILRGIVGRTFAVYVRHYWTFLIALGLFELIWAFTAGRLESTLDRTVNRAGEAGINSLLGLAFFLGVIVLQVVLSALSEGLLTAVAINVAGPAYLGDQVDGAGAWGRTKDRLGSIIGLSALVSVVEILLAVTVIGIPWAIYLLVRWSLAMQVIVLEDEGVWAALKRSSQLVHGSWWRVLGILIVLVGMEAIPLILLGYATGSLVTALVGGSVSEALIGTVSSTLAVVLVGAFFPVGTTILYYDLRVRRGEFRTAPVGLVEE